jgi:hypothetical protein
VITPVRTNMSPTITGLVTIVVVQIPAAGDGPHQLRPDRGIIFAPKGRNPCQNTGRGLVDK